MSHRIPYKKITSQHPRECGLTTGIVVPLVCALKAFFAGSAAAPSLSQFQRSLWSCPSLFFRNDCTGQTRKLFHVSA